MSKWPTSYVFLLIQIRTVSTIHVQLQKGVSSARSDDTKSLKGVVLEWITPRDVALNPPLTRNVKTNRGFHHNATGALLCPAGLNWNDAEYVLFPPACLIPILLTL